MSFERFSSSDIYIYEHIDGFIECCGCWIGHELKESAEEELNFWFVQLKTPREALEHLDRHEAAGFDVGKARSRIIKSYPDLDVKIKPYEQNSEVLERIKTKIKKIINN
jgi:hypothetical protein